MFADDFILITKASRYFVRNTLFCLNLYASITGQNPNLNKSAIYLPTWFNKRVSKAISSILGIKLGNLPFLYLGARISPSRVPIRQFTSLVKKTESTIHHGTILIFSKLADYSPQFQYVFPSYLSPLHLLSP